MSRQPSQLERQDIEPRYRQLADILAREVCNEYLPGDLLPSESVLARRFSVNRHTVRRALDELVAAGMVTRHQGLGTQVVDRRLDYSLSAASKVTHNLAELGLQTESRCLAQALAVPPEAIAQRFSCEERQTLLCVDTLRFADGAALLRLRHWFDPERVPDWTRRYRGGSTRALLDQHYGLRLTRAQVRVEACQADAEDCRLLQCSRHAPLLVLTSDNVDHNRRLVEISISRARADRVGYHVDFTSTDFSANPGPNGRRRCDQDHHQNEVSP